MPKPDQPTNEPVAQYERAREEICKAEFSVFKDRQYFSIRCWYMDEKTQEHKPGRNGINLPVEEKEDFLGLIVALFPDDIQLVEKEEE